MDEKQARKNIESYIRNSGYTYTVDALIDSYLNYYKQGYYVSYTTKDCIQHLEREFELLTLPKATESTEPAQAETGGTHD